MDKIFVTKTFLPPKEEFIEEISKIWDSHWLTNQGPIHEELSQQLIDKYNLKNVTLFTNGHLALEAAIQVLNLTGEVITTPFTFASTTHAIVRNRLTPVFCDIDENTGNIDADKIEELITEKTSAILAVHVYGNPCDVYKIEKIAKKYNLKIIYDAAHAFGVEIDGKNIGNFGDISMFSFHSTKVFHTIEGGMLTYNNDNYKKTFDYLKNFGIKNSEEVDMIGFNAKMSEFQAVMGLLNLKYIDENIQKRKNIYNAYKKSLDGIKGINFLKKQKNIKDNYAYMPVIIDGNCGVTRNELFDYLVENNIMSRKYFYPLISDYTCYKDKYNDSNLIIAKKISDGVMCLPIYPDLTLDTISYINNHIKRKILK